MQYLNKSFTVGLPSSIYGCAGCIWRTPFQPAINTPQVFVKGKPKVGSGCLLSTACYPEGKKSAWA